MSSLYLKSGGGWYIPQNVYAKVGGSWVPCSAVWRNNGGTWVKHWPSPVDFGANRTIYDFAAVSATANTGSWSSWKTLLIPDSIVNGMAMSNAICHIHRLKITLLDSFAADDWDSHASAISGNLKVTLDGKYTVIQPPGLSYHMGPLSYSSIFETPDRNQQNAYNFGEIGVPANHLLVGVTFQVGLTRPAGSAGSGFKFQLITAPIVPSRPLTLSGGLTTFNDSTETVNVGGQPNAGSNSSASIADVNIANHTVRQVGLGVGYKLASIAWANDDVDEGGTTWTRVRLLSQQTGIV